MVSQFWESRPVTRAGLHGRQRPQVAFLSQRGSHRRATGALGRDKTLIFFLIGSMRLVYLTTFV